MKKCRWCIEEINDGASVCPNCQLPQSSFRRATLFFESSGTLIISFFSLLISGVALWYSIHGPKIEPEISSHVAEYKEENLKVLAFNFGNAPTFVTYAGMKINLAQNDTMHSLEVGFDIPNPVLLEVGGTNVIDLRYDSYQTDWSKWESSGGKDKFELGFLAVAAGMGNNLHCEVTLVYSTTDYTDYKKNKSSFSNGNCIPAMTWFAKEIGPLKVSE